MPRACAHEVVGGELENASCCCIDFFLWTVSELNGERSSYGQA